MIHLKFVLGIATAILCVNLSQADDHNSWNQSNSIEIELFDESEFADAQEFNIRDYYSELLNRFNSARNVPSADDIDGWFTGRCYYNNRRSIPVATILIGEKFDGSNGPIFPDLIRYWSGVNWQGAPDYYDDMSGSQKRAVKRAWQSNIVYTRPAGIVNGALTVNVPSGRGWVQWALKKQGDYYYLRVGGPNPFFAPLGMCYYFEEI